MKLSYAITTHNEYDEINELLGLLIHHIDKDDEICILDDYSDERTQEVFKSWVQQYGDKVNIKIKQRALNKDFATHKIILILCVVVIISLIWMQMKNHTMLF